MNWTIIIIGNIIMDSAVGLFAILAGFETRLHRYAKELEQEGQLRQIHEEYEGKKPKGPRPLTKDEMDAILELGKADKISPYMGKTPYLLASMFIIGVILQILGLIIPDTIFDC